MPTNLEERRAGYSRLARIVTAVCATLATAILFGFLSSVQDLVKQGPMLAAHMASTNQKLSSIELELASSKMAIASLTKDYTSREQLQGELEKINEKIRAMQVQQAVLEMILKTDKTGSDRRGGSDGQFRKPQSAVEPVTALPAATVDLAGADAGGGVLVCLAGGAP